MKNSAYHITFLLVVVGAFSLNAQTRLFFGVSALDRLTDNEVISSYVTTLNKNTSCVQVQSGVFAYYGIIGSRIFLADCSTTPVNNKIEIKLFPNPAVNYTRLQSTALLSDNPTLIGLSFVNWVHVQGPPFFSSLPIFIDADMAAELSGPFTNF